MADSQPNKKTSEEPTATSLALTDLLRVVQGTGTALDPYVSKKTTMSGLVSTVLAHAPVGGVQTVTSSDATKLLVNNTDPANLILTPLGSSGGGLGLMRPDDVLTKPGETWTVIDNFKGSTIGSAWTLIDPTGGKQTIAPSSQGLLMHIATTAQADYRTNIVRPIVRSMGGGSTAAVGDAYCCRFQYCSWNFVNYLANRIVLRDAGGAELSFVFYWMHGAAQRIDSVIETGTNVGRASNTGDVFLPLFIPDMWLRAVYTGANSYRLDYSEDGRLWRAVTTTTATNTFTQVGVGCSNFAGGVEGNLAAIDFGYMTGVA